MPSVALSSNCWAPVRSYSAEQCEALKRALTRSMTRCILRVTQPCNVMARHHDLQLAPRSTNRASTNACSGCKRWHCGLYVSQTSEEGQLVDLRGCTCLSQLRSSCSNIEIESRFERTIYMYRVQQWRYLNDEWERERTYTDRCNVRRRQNVKLL